MKYSIIAFLLCIASFWPTTYGQYTGQEAEEITSPEEVSIKNLLPSDFERLPDEIKLQIIYPMIEKMPLDEALKTLSSLETTNKDLYRISHDKIFDSYWALIQDKNLYKTLKKRNLIQAIRIIQSNPKLQNIDSHSWAIQFHKMISYLPVEFIEKLLNFALDPQAIDAFRTEHSDLNRWLLAASKNRNLDLYDNNALEILYSLIAGAYINFKPSTYGGKPALIEAVQANNPVVVRLLLDNGADINIKTLGDTALKIAAGWGYVDMVKLLLDYGADGRVAALDHLITALNRTPAHEKIIQLLKTYKPQPQ